MKKSVKEQILKDHSDFATEVETISISALRARIVTLQQVLEESEQHKEANETLQQARDQVKELAGPYRDVKKAINLKTRYILEMLASKGG